MVAQISTVSVLASHSHLILGYVFDAVSQLKHAEVWIGPIGLDTERKLTAFEQPLSYTEGKEINISERIIVAAQ